MLHQLRFEGSLLLRGRCGQVWRMPELFFVWMYQLSCRSYARPGEEI
jgi:hypothetical protein